MHNGHKLPIIHLRQRYLVLIAVVFTPIPTGMDTVQGQMTMEKHGNKINNSSVKKVNCLLFNGSTLYAGVVGYGVYSTSDDGTTWTLHDKGLSGNASTQRSVSYLSSENNILYASTNYGLYTSRDNGSNWVGLTDGGWPTPVFATAPASVTAVKGSTIYTSEDGYPIEGVYISENAGSSWTKTSSTEKYLKAILFVGNSVLIGSDNGVFSSSDNGKTWTNERSSDFSKKNVTSLISDATYIYAGTGSDLWKRPISEFSSTTTEVKQSEMLESLNVYPNPTSGKINILRNNNESATLQVINIQGEVVREEQITNQTSINLSGKGIYFLKLKDGTNSYAKKIIVQ